MLLSVRPEPADRFRGVNTPEHEGIKIQTITKQRRKEKEDTCNLGASQTPTKALNGTRNQPRTWLPPPPFSENKKIKNQ